MHWSTNLKNVQGAVCPIFVYVSSWRHLREKKERKEGDAREKNHLGCKEVGNSQHQWNNCNFNFISVILIIRGELVPPTVNKATLGCPSASKS